MSGAACPCASGLSYAECCGPYHAGERAPESPERVLRTRFAAFARMDATYLARTDLDEPDPDALRAELKSSQRGRVFRAFRILDVGPEDETGSAEMLYFIDVRHRGKDVSFVEHGFFARVEEGFVYAGGTVSRPPARRAELDSLRLPGR